MIAQLLGMTEVEFDSVVYDDGRLTSVMIIRTFGMMDRLDVVAMINAYFVDELNLNSTLQYSLALNSMVALNSLDKPFVDVIKTLEK